MSIQTINEKQLKLLQSQMKRRYKKELKKCHSGCEYIGSCRDYYMMINGKGADFTLRKISKCEPTEYNDIPLGGEPA